MSGKRRWLSIIAAAIAALAILSCTKTDQAMVKQLSDLQAPPGKAGTPSKQTMEELQNEVARYQSEVNRVFDSTQKLGRAYQMLALKYFNNKMYGPALRSFKQAINIYPTNPVLSYMAGLCQAQLAKVEVNPQAQQDMFDEAATYYKNALSINGSYKDALYALSILDIFELNKPSEAEPHLKKLTSLDPKDTDALFLLARVYASEGHPEEAAKLYDKISTSDASAEQKSRAQENKKKILEGAFGK